MSGVNACKRTGVRRVIKRAINTRSLDAAIGCVEPGAEIFLLNKGQFSLSDVLLFLLDQVGPSKVYLATWTAAGADLAHTKALLDSGMITGMQWMLDSSFPQRQPAYFRQLRELFSDENVCVVKTHCKFAVIEAECGRRLALRTSANLNLNKRIESFEISEDEELASYLLDIFAEAKRLRMSVDKPEREIKELTQAELFGSVEASDGDVIETIPLAVGGMSWD